ncbi:FRIGIDA-like protein 5 isoform X2 [Lycium barbarum]|uniref:FRIGIDA-like protein 5 isoform X2 n=1 Tax=Lycium barbarum TaxID=112863 RepID=UPI00293E11AB|nr:FRIGIDA-like protein 5 isoform X2 [Lycium barbarum]
MEISMKEKEFEEKLNKVREESHALHLKERKFAEDSQVKEDILQSREKELETKLRSLDTAMKELTMKENRLDTATKELETNIKSLDSARKELTVKENRLDKATKEHETKVTSLDSAKNELTMKENRLDNATKELREKELREKAMLTKELQEKTSNVDSLKKKLTIKEDHLTSMKKELAHNDKSLGTINNQLELQGLELNLLEGKVQLREGELSSIKKELREKVTMLDSVTKVLQGKTSDLNSLKKQLSINKDHLTSMRKKLEHKDKSVDTIRNKLELKEQEFNLLEGGHQLREGELSSCKRELREKVTMLDSVTKELQGKTSNLDSLKKKLTINEDHLTTMKKKLEHKDKSVDTIKNKLELKEQELNLLEERLQLREGELSSVQEGYRQPSEELDSTKKKLDLVDGEFQLEKEKYQTEQGLFKKSMKDIELKEKQVEVKFREVEQRKKHMEDRFKVLEEKMKQLKTIGNAPEPIDNVEADTTSTDSADIKLVLTMDGKALQIFLNEHEKKLDSMSDDVFRTLHLSRNPAQLVLDAMEGFYPPHLMMMKGDTEFEGSVARKTCILLLEQLIRVSPKIQPTVSERAMKLASEWKFKMTGNQLEILGFLYLLASFNLVFAFDADELMNLLAVVAEHNKSKELCRLLGFTENIPCFKADVTASVISEAQKPQQTQLKHKESTSPSGRADIKALSYTSSTGKASTCMLGHSNAMAAILVSMGGKNLQTFLNNHWKEQELLRIEISRALKLSSDSGMLVLEALEGFYPPEPHNEEILFDRSVIRKSCIFLLEQLMILSPKLKPEAKLEARKLAFDWKEKMKAETEDHLGILGFLLLVGAYGLASAFDKDELESLCHTAAQDDNAYPIFHVLGIAGEHPSKTEPLSNNVEMKCKGCDLTSGCSLSFIHCLSDPAKVVLDALRKCRSTNLGKYKYGPLVMKSFSDLLEHLREVSPEITPQVKIDAIVLAVEWQKTFTGSQLNPSEVLGFLQLLATFELSSSFDSDELLPLLKIVYNSKRAINLFKILELADKIPCFIENLIKRKQWLLAIRYIYVYELVDLFPPVPLLKDYVLYSKEQAKKIRDNGLGSREAQEKAINCEISVLRAAIKCILSRNLQSEYSPDILRARIAKLQRQMADLRIPNQHSGNDRDEGTLCAPASQVQKAATKKRLASATEGVSVHESRLQHCGDDRGEGTLCAPICQSAKSCHTKTPCFSY